MTRMQTFKPAHADPGKGPAPSGIPAGLSHGGRRERKPESDSSTCGLLLIDKPEGMTSFDVVAQVKRRLRPRKVGHCGTLDPFATGVLVLCLNQATRIVDQLSDHDKVYRCTLRFGIETDTLDRTGRITRECDGPCVSQGELLRVMGRFTGQQEQEVPLYSAVHVEGKRLHQLARKGVEVERLPRRQVFIHGIELLDHCWPRATIEVRCSKGTYIRQLAADVGRAAGCGAHVAELRRLASGPFHIERALPLNELLSREENSGWKNELIPMDEAVDYLPAVRMNRTVQIKRLRDGCLDLDWEAESRRLLPAGTPLVRILHEDGSLAALWWPGPQPGQGNRLRILQREP